MERESFEDQEVADYLNQHFIAIKVDREERPDIDQIYMDACMAMTGQGGWPLTLILTPQGKPFFAGTYFPKTRKYGHMGLVDLLPRIVEVWINERGKAESIGEQLTNALRDARQKEVRDQSPDSSFFTDLYENLASSFDESEGGFGEAPKFPSPQNLLFLLRYHAKNHHEQALSMVLRTLEKMHRGGIYDHIGGGFSRYSTDPKWLVPHFEKMLYDNALLTHAFLDAYHVTQDPVWEGIARHILDYVLRDMCDDDGAFFAAEDADSEGEEGKFYLFSVTDIQSILGDDAKSFIRYFGMTEKGNFEGKNILHLQTITNQEWHDWVLKSSVASHHMTEMVKKVFTNREERVHPFKDDKVLLGWNGLMISALAKAARLTGENHYLGAAIRANDFLNKHLRGSDGRYYSRYRDGEVKHLAFLDDYAYFAWAKLELYETTMEISYLQQAVKLAKAMEQLFCDQDRGGYFLSGLDAETLITRSKSWYEGALPSGNSVATYVLAKLAMLTGQEDIIAARDRQIYAGYGEARKHPSGYAFYAMALQLVLWPTKEVVIATKDKNQEDPWVTAIQRKFLPQMSLLHRSLDEESTINEIAPFTIGQNPLNGEPAAYVCENFACHTPVTSWRELENLL